jgi:uncharacterized membrane protein
MKEEHLLLLSYIETYKLYSCNGYIIIILGGFYMRYGNCIDGYFGHGLSNGMGYYGSGSYLLWMTGIIIIIAVLFIAFVYNKKNKNISYHEAAEALILRYVNGEITEEEYQRMKKMIQ